jgi:hypothetical protein
MVTINCSCGFSTNSPARAQAHFDANPKHAQSPVRVPFSPPAQPEELSEAERERVRHVQARLPDQQRQLAKKARGAKFDRKALRDRS